MKSRSTFLALLLLAAPVFHLAADNEQVGTRPPAPKTTQVEETSAPQESHCGFVFDRYPPVYFPASCHWMIAASAFGDTLELEDGSVWKVNSYDSYKALNWRANDPLMVTQNTRWFSSYTYRIINRNTGSSIETNLFLGPIKGGEHTRYINAMDFIQGALSLTDTTRWEVSSSDQTIFREWLLKDPVITR